MSKRSVLFTAGTVLLLAMMMVLPAFAADATLNPAHSGATNSEFSTGSCPTPPEGQEGWWGWHFIMPGNEDFTSLSVTFQNAGTFSANPFPGTVFVAHPDNSHAYIWTPTDDTLLSGTATSSGRQTQFNLSHVCHGESEDVESLSVSKTVNTEYTREHFWDIAKDVDTENDYIHNGYDKVWLYTNGDGDETVTWTVDVTYEGYLDSAWRVYGDITIVNDGDLDAVITSVDDVLAGAPITVDCGVTFPYTLAVDETLICTYSENGYVEGQNEASVTTEVDTYDAEPVDIVWGDPTTEVNKTVNVKDISDLFGEVNLGSVTAPNDRTFTYSKDFAWADYGADGCGDFTYENTATIVETEQSASATLKVNVQCYIYETAFGKGPNAACFIPDFNRWGWTNPLQAEDEIVLDLWAGAGKCDTNKGTYVGTVTVTASGGTVTFEYNLLDGFLLDETHSYAGPDKYPQVKQGKKLVSTVAPGQYYIVSPFTGGWAIAHAVVGIPDPNFGPGISMTAPSAVLLPAFDR